MTDTNGLHSVRVNGVTRIGHARLKELKGFIEDDLGLRVWWSNAGDSTLLVRDGTEAITPEKLEEIREYPFAVTSATLPATVPELDVAGAMATHAFPSQGI